MKKLSILAVLALALVCASNAHAQAYVRYDNILLSSRGLPLAGATIAVCTQPAVTSTTPCSPLAAIYSDNAGTQPLNPLTTDANGNYHFYVSPATCGPGATGRTIQYYGGNVVPNFMADQTPNAGTGCGLLPTTPNGVPQVCTSTPSGSVAQPGGFNLPGVPVDARLTGTEAIAATDRGELVTFNNGSSPVALSIPQAGTSFATNNFSHAACNLGTGLVTYTPGAGSTINSLSSVPLPPQWCGYLYSDNSNYRFAQFPSYAAFPTTTNAQPLQFNSGTGALSVCTSCLVETPINSAATSIGSNINSTTIIAANATQLYEIVWYISETTIGASCSAASNTAALTIAWTDLNGNSVSSVVGTLTASANGTAGQEVDGIKSVAVQSSTNITYSVASTLSSTGCSPAPKYTVFFEAVN